MSGGCSKICCYGSGVCENSFRDCGACFKMIVLGVGQNLRCPKVTCNGSGFCGNLFGDCVGYFKMILWGWTKFALESLMIVLGFAKIHLGIVRPSLR